MISIISTTEAVILVIDITFQVMWLPHVSGMSYCMFYCYVHVCYVHVLALIVPFQSCRQPPHVQFFNESIGIWHHWSCFLLVCIVVESFEQKEVEKVKVVEHGIIWDMCCINGGWGQTVILHQ